MRKIGKVSEAFWLFGILLVALGVTLCSKADLGVSMIAAPAFVLQEFIVPFFPAFTVGMCEYIIQGLLLLLLCVTVRQFSLRYLSAFAIALLYGVILDLFLLIFDDLSFDSVWLRWVMLFVGDVVTAIGVACLFRTYMPLQVYELFVTELSAHFQFNVNKVKAIFDLSLLLLSLGMAVLLFGDLLSFDFRTAYYASFHNIGAGTLFTTAINAFLIACSGRLLDRFFEATAAFPKFKKLLKR